MRGHVRRPSGMKTWQTIYELGEQPAQRCQSCNKRFWVERRRLEACPACGGELIERSERRQGCRSGFRTKKEAEQALTDILGTLQQGTYVQPAKITAAEFLRDEWLPAIAQSVRPTTFLSYRTHVEAHLLSGLGTTSLQKLTPAAINRFYGKLLTEPRASRRRGKKKSRTKTEEVLKPLAASSVRRVHATLHRALRDAVRWGYLQRNPADVVALPSLALGDRAEMTTWSAKDLKTFLEKAANDRLYPLWRLLASTGLRRGEALGLRWEDVDLSEEAPSLMVRQTLVAAGYAVTVSEPKTKRGRRTVALDAATAASLRTWREAQDGERKNWGPASAAGDLVFRREDGAPWHPDRVTKLFQDAVVASGLPRIRLHDLRHTHASIALSADINPKVVSDRLGHSTVAFTLDIYSHCVPALSREAADKIAALVAAG